MLSSEKPDRTADDPAKTSYVAFKKLVIGDQGLVGENPYTDRDAMKDVIAS